MIRTAAQRVASKFIKQASSELELHVFDFDMTLFKSPEPPSWWSKKNGYWYSVVDSLGRPFIPDSPRGSEFWIDDVVRQAKSSISDPDVWSILCTGRIDTPPLRYRISEILASKGLDFDDVFLSAGKGNTAAYKAKVVLNNLKKLPRISTVKMWDDDRDNLEVVGKLCDKLGVAFIPDHITEGSPYEPKSTEQDYQVLKAEWK